MKYDYYIEGKKYNSKVEALEFCKSNIRKRDFELIRRVKRVDEVLIPSVREFIKKNIPFKNPTISPLIISKKATEKKEEKKSNKKGLVVTKFKVPKKKLKELKVKNGALA